MSKKYLINYADGCCYQSQKMNSQTGVQFGFNGVFECSRKDLRPDFVKENESILNETKGAGYWLWKPYICLHALLKINEGDILFYCDSGAYFVSDMNPIFSICENTDHNFMAFHIDPIKDNTETKQTKRDVFIKLGCDDRDDIKYTYPRNGAFICVKKTDFAIDFFREYLKLCQDKHLLTDEPSIAPNYIGFDRYRHDQSIYSVLSKLRGIKSFRDPSQFGNPFIQESDGYKQLITHHRNKQ